MSINAQLSGGLYDATQGQVNDLMDALTIGQKGLKALSETLINCAAMEKSGIASHANCFTQSTSALAEPLLRPTLPLVE